VVNKKTRESLQDEDPKRPLQAQHWEDGLVAFETHISRHQALFEGEAIFANQREWHKELRSVLDDAHELIDQFLEDEMSFSELGEAMKDDIYESLEESLQSPPQLFRNPQPAFPKKCEPLLDGLEALVERLNNELQLVGGQLGDILICASYEPIKLK